MIRSNLKYYVLSIIALLILASCSREKKLYDDKVVETRIEKDGKEYILWMSLEFDSPRQMEIEGVEVTRHGKIDIIEGGQSLYLSSANHVSYIITNVVEDGGTGYDLSAVCYDEKLPPKSSKRKSRRGSNPTSYIGDVVGMHLDFDNEKLSYELSCAPVGFLGIDTQWGVYFSSGLDEYEARQASTSLLSGYFDKDIKLYPSKYLGNWVAEYEGLILCVVALLIVLAIIFGDWWSVLFIPIVTWLTLYTSYMVFLPVFPFLVLIPLSYIPKISDGIAFVISLGILIGLYLLWPIYQSSTFWNTLVMAVVWLVGLSAFFGYIIGHEFGEHRRCKESCGYRLHTNYLDSYYINNGIDKVESYIPESNSSGCTTVRDVKVGKNSEKICFKCSFE